MKFQFDISSQSAAAPAPPATSDSPTELLRQLVDLQRENLTQILQVQRDHLAHARAVAGDHTARFRTLLARWQESLPGLQESCKKSYPVLERTYIHLLAEMMQDLVNLDEDGLDTDFALQEFLDRYGQRIGQLSHLVHLVGSLAEAAHQNEASAAAAAGGEKS